MEVLRIVFFATALTVACGGRVPDATPTSACPGSQSGTDSKAANAEPPSCAPEGPGTTQCGSAAESCCTSLEVPGGTYFRNYYNDGSGPSQETDPATVSSFRLDKYLVTVGRFRRFVEAWQCGWKPSVGSGKHAHLNGGLGLAIGGQVGSYEPGWVAADDSQVAPTNANLSDPGCNIAGSSTWEPSPAGQENLPINCVNWFEAYAFCIWDGGFLPSEAEWEYAAAGGNEQREYPWGSADPGTTNQYAIFDCAYPSGLRSPSAPPSACTAAPVGTAASGAGRWGHFDMAGEVSEWHIDHQYWDQNDYPSYVDPCADCTYLTTAPDGGRLGPLRSVRGGAFYDVPSSVLVPPEPGYAFSFDRDDAFGLRCARTP
jgi:formylglycine-generating enzyme